MNGLPLTEIQRRKTKQKKIPNKLVKKLFLHSEVQSNWWFSKVKGKSLSVDQSVLFTNGSHAPDACANSNSFNAHTKIRLTLGDFFFIFHKLWERVKGPMDEGPAKVYNESSKKWSFSVKKNLYVCWTMTLSPFTRKCMFMNRMTKLTFFNQTVCMIQDLLLNY